MKIPFFEFRKTYFQVNMRKIFCDKMHLFLISEADTEELEKELHNLLLDSSRDLPDLPSVPQKPLFPVVLPSISDAELEAELEKLTLDGGMCLSWVLHCLERSHR